MRPTSILLFGVCLTVAAPAGAQSRVLPAYVGIDYLASIGGGFEGHVVEAMGGELFFGYRISSWASIEGGYAAHTSTATGEQGGGAICLGSGFDHYTWQTLGARVWFHLLHIEKFDVSIGPTIAGGITSDRVTPYGGVGSPCYFEAARRPPLVALDGGIDLGLEWRPVPWFGLRLRIDTGIQYGVGVLAVQGAIGPVLRF